MIEEEAMTEKVSLRQEYNITKIRNGYLLHQPSTGYSLADVTEAFLDKDTLLERLRTIL